MSKIEKVTWIGKILRVAMVVTVMLCVSMAYADVAPAAEGAAVQAVETATNPAIFYAIAITMSCGCLASAIAVGKIGAAVMGAAAEKPEILGKAIAFVGLGEGIALFGFLISMFLIFKI